MKKSGIIVGIIAMSFFIIVTGCNYPKQHPVYSLVWEKPTVLDTNYVANGQNNPNSGQKIKGYYTQYNLIIDTTNLCYFYNNGSRRHGGCCGTGNWFDTPEFIELNPDKMVVVSDNDLAAFLDVNLRKDFRGEIYLMVASPVDTIRQESYKIIVEYIKNKNNIYNVGIRLTTEEEKNVILCKKKNIQYNFEDYEWQTKFSNITPKFNPKSVRCAASQPTSK